MRGRASIRGRGYIWAVALLAMFIAAVLNARIPLILGDLTSNAQRAATNQEPWGVAAVHANLVLMAACFLGRELCALARTVIVH